MLGIRGMAEMVNWYLNAAMKSRCKTKLSNVEALAHVRACDKFRVSDDHPHIIPHNLLPKFPPNDSTLCNRSYTQGRICVTSASFSVFPIREATQMSVLELAYDQARKRASLLPGAVVMAVVLLLVHGFMGTGEVLLRMIGQFLASLFGGGDGDAVSGVLWRTLPLGLSAAVAAFAVSSRWLDLTSMFSYVWIAIIVLFGTAAGNACYEAFAPKQVIVTHNLTAPPRPDETVNGYAKRLYDMNKKAGIELSVLVPPEDVGLAGLATPTIMPTKPSAWERFSKLNWLEKPDLSRKPQPVEPLFEVKVGGIWGWVCQAVAQLLGYVVDYQPRLFLASVIAGSFMGWRLQRRLVTAQAVVTGDFTELTDTEIERLAA